MSIGLIVPTYGHYDYALRTVTSFLENSPVGSCAYVLDDAHSDWASIDWSKWPTHLHVPTGTPSEELLTIPRNEHRVVCYHFKRHKHLSRSWNMGLRLARSAAWRTDMVICGNSDILFTPNWYEPIYTALDHCQLVGPLTNAPGRIFMQNVKKWLPSYELTDNQDALTKTAKQLAKKYEDKPYKITDRINGFFMAAFTDTWWRYGYDEDHVFDPRWTMRDCAYNLQHVFRHNRCKIALVPSSFIFHYRSVSRGFKGLDGGRNTGAWRATKEPDSDQEA